MDPNEIGHHLGRLVKGNILYMESMRRHTSWRIGGPADIMVMPSDIEDINQCVSFSREYGIPLTVIGNGSNTLVKDKGIRGIVLKISKGFDKIEVNGTTITAQAGALVPLLAKRAAAEGLGGMEFAVGIPASVGGAILMNAGAHGKCMADVVSEVQVLTPDGNITSLSNGRIGFAYRKSDIKANGLIVLRVEFSLSPGNPAEISAANNSNLAKRRRSQPLEFPNAGSVFANPPGQWAGWLIEQVGGKGMRVGDAMVSEKHANFIVNRGDATAVDTISLISRIKQMVMEQFNIELKLEVQVIGE